MVRDKAGYKVLKVRKEDMLSFRNQYAGRILFEAETFAELLQLFAAQLEKVRT